MFFSLEKKVHLWFISKPKVMKPPKTIKNGAQIHEQELTQKEKYSMNRKARKSIVFPFKFLKRKVIVNHSIPTLMNAFMHMIRETELNIKIYRTLNHERALPKRKFVLVGKNRSLMN